MVKLNLQIPEAFYQEEMRDGYLVSSEMKKVWAVELDLLNEFSKVCAIYNLKWFADAGTILGAIRHKGMIPWDDDIDVMMLREDYDKFCKIASEAFNHPYFFQSPETEPTSIYGHAKIRNSETTAILSVDRDKKYKFNQGIFLDVFPIDNIPDDDNELKAYTDEIAGIRYRQWQLMENFHFCKNPIRLIKRIIKHVVRKWNRTSDSILLYAEHEKLLHKYQNERTSRIAKLVMLPFKERRIWPKEFLKEQVFVPFEMLSIPVPVRYEELLNKFYGNWHEYSIGPSSHGGVLFDTEKSYKYYIK